MLCEGSDQACFRRGEAYTKWWMMTKIYFLPLQLYHRFHERNLTLVIRAAGNKLPVMNFTENGVDLFLPAALDVYVNEENGKMPLAFSLGVVCTSLITVHIYYITHISNAIHIYTHTKARISDGYGLITCLLVMAYISDVIHWYIRRGWSLLASEDSPHRGVGWKTWYCCAW